MTENKKKVDSILKKNIVYTFKILTTQVLK